MAQTSSSQNGWQDAKPNVHARISHLLQNDFMSDFTFVSEDVKFPVHKFILASTSSVFYAMFYGPMAEQKQELDLSSFGNAECITQFLKLIYTDEVSLNWKTVFQLLNLAKCYLISSLQKRCTEFIEKSVTKDNALIALQQSLLFDANDAIKKCLEIISENAPQIVEQDSFLALNLASLKAILQLDTLEINEIDLFLAVNSWCESQLIKEGKEVSTELKRKVFGDAVYLIRFPCMELKDFGEYCSKSGLLTLEQVADIIHFISVHGKDLQETLMDKIGFCTKPRKKRREEIIADRILHNKNIWGHWGYLDKKPDSIDFTINKKAYLTGISLFGNPRSNIISQMTITTNARTLKPFYTFGERNSGPVSESFRVSFEKPIEILANQKVNVCVVISGPNSRSIYDNAKEIFKIDGFQCRFSTASNSSHRTDVESGQFPALIFEI
eukprot:Seg8680.3 transcript_id=Seg8680.3/GoldUCD/mRNA.D3Y31 product="BTB/POZ domain-containing protein 2" protein_id=Seg8680.3/GoldUCD/D3Y31